MSLRRLAGLFTVVLVALCSWAAESADVKSADVKEVSNRLVGSIFTGPSMNNLRDLTDGYGGRLTGSPAYQRAVEWAVARFRSYGIQNVRVEPFTLPNGWQRGWARGEMLAPYSRRLNLESLGWSPSTPSGGIKGDLVVIDDISPDNIKTKAGQIRGHIVLLDAEKALEEGVWKKLNDLLNSPQRFKDAGALAVVIPDSVPNNVLDAFALDWGGKLSPIPTAQLGMEDGKLIRRELEQGPVTIQFAFENKTSGPLQVNNVIAEIPGHDHPDEWILIGAHFDSWDYGTGAQDNGTGSAMVMEVARAFAALGQQPSRTIRFALWGGEEEGLVGSTAYVNNHSAELEKCVAVLNTDNGSGHPKGWKVQGRKDLRDAMQPISDSLLKDLSGDELSMKTTYDTDHGPFMLRGIPALDLLVDMSKYREVHHKSSDTFDKVDPLYLKGGAAIVAVTAWAIAQQAQPIAPHIDHAAVADILKKANLDEFLTQAGVWKP
jgi:carboxypeptidase Q